MLEHSFSIPSDSFLFIYVEAYYILATLIAVFGVLSTIFQILFFPPFSWPVITYLTNYHSTDQLDYTHSREADSHLYGPQMFWWHTTPFQMVNSKVYNTIWFCVMIFGMFDQFYHLKHKCLDVNKFAMNYSQRKSFFTSIWYQVERTSHR